MSKNIETNKLFVASCLALLVTSLSFGIRAGVLSQQGIDFNLDSAQLGTIAATAFWGFPLAILVGGTIVDIIGMKRLMADLSSRGVLTLYLPILLSPLPTHQAFL